MPRLQLRHFFCHCSCCPTPVLSSTCYWQCGSACTSMTQTKKKTCFAKRFGWSINAAPAQLVRRQKLALPMMETNRLNSSDKVWTASDLILLNPLFSAEASIASHSFGVRLWRTQLLQVETDVTWCAPKYQQNWIVEHLLVGTDWIYRFVFFHGRCSWALTHCTWCSVRKRGWLDLCACPFPAWSRLLV